MLVPIDDPSDPRLDDIRDLKHSDQQKDLVFAEGPLVAGRLVESRFPVRAVFGFGGRLESFLADYGAELERRLARSDEPIAAGSRFLRRERTPLWPRRSCRRRGIVAELGVEA